MGISIGLVGLGSFGSVFADLFKHHPMVDRIALCDREPERIARFASKESFQDKFKPRDCYETLDEICRSDLDALAIFSQHWLHAPQCIQAMESGKHVYSAVPLISIPSGDETLEWCDKLIRTCRKTGLSYMLGETTYYHADTMFCRRQATKGAFGDFIYSEGEYMHSFDSPASDLREVYRIRFASQAGQEWVERLNTYRERGETDSPMSYPTHSMSGPMSVMHAHAVKVSAWGTPPRTKEPYFQEMMMPYSNVTALYQMSNHATMRICEHRECAIIRETFRVYGTKGAYENGVWYEKERATPLNESEIRDPLPRDVYEAYRNALGERNVYGGHGGSHAYLVNEFVDAVAHSRMPVINAWEAARFTAAGVMAHKSCMMDGEILSVPDWGDAPSSS